MDLRDFFPTFGGARIQTVFRTFGYPESVADLLGGICTNATARNVWNNCVRSGPESQNRDGRSRFRPHLEGRVAFVEMINPTKGRRLRMIFDRIRWPE
jgi:hypothetical protein